MNKTQKYIQENKAAAFDWFVFTITFSLGFVFPTLKDLIISSWFSKLMLAALVLYVAGIWLKRFPVYYRIITSGKKQETVPYVLFLIIGHWLLMLVAVIFSTGAVKRLMGIHTAIEQKGEGWEIFISIVLSILITWLVFHGQTKLKNGKKYSPQYLFRREFIADICLIMGVSIFSFVFWEKGILAMLASKPAANMSDVWFLFVFLSIAYMLCYLPLRYLFLLEDHNRKGTWKRMLLILAFLLIKSVFEMLNI